MQTIMSYYCWIKQVGLDSPQMQPRASGRPPTSKAGKLAFTAQLELGQDDGDQLDVPDSMMAVPALHLAWAAHPMFPGNPKLGIIRYKAGYGSLKDALTIRDTDPTWFDDAVQYFLMTFGMRGPRVLTQANLSQFTDIDVQPTNFPAYTGSWEREFKAEATRSTSFLGRAWTEFKLDTSLGKGLDTECPGVRTAMDLWDGKEVTGKPDGPYATLARREHLSAWHAALTLFEAAGKPDPYGAKLFNAIEFVTRLIDESLPPLSYLKQRYNVERPAVACGPFSTHLPVPGHASFPSGHATQAWLVALALTSDQRLPTGIRTAIENAARGIALRRVVAGLHFEMDAVAGKALAQMMLAGIASGDAQKKKEFDALLAAAVDDLLKA